MGDAEFSSHSCERIADQVQENPEAEIEEKSKVGVKPIQSSWDSRLYIAR